MKTLSLDMDPLYERWRLEVEICRLCFTMAGNQQPVTNSPFAQEFNKFNFIELQIGYDLPTKVCGQCLLQLNQLGSFLKMCKDSFHIYKRMRINQQSLEPNRQVTRDIDDIKQEANDYESEEAFETTIDVVDESETLFANFTEKESFFETATSQTTKTELDSEDFSSCDENDDTESKHGMKDGIKTCQTCGVNVTALWEHYSKSPQCLPRISHGSTGNLYFRSKHKLPDHQKTHHPDRIPATLLICHICSKKFKYPTNLNQHLQTHEDDKQDVYDQSGNISNSSVSGKPQCTPLEIAEIPRDAIDNLLPPKSSSVYQAAYQRFINWCAEKNVHDYTENVLLAYFAEQSSELKMKSSTMWSQYSKIKALLNIKHGIDLSKYLKLRAYLKKQNEGYKPKKARALSKEQFDRFLSEAPDDKYLGLKVILVLGISGACRCDELVKMRVDDIQDLGSLLFIKIPDRKINKTRSFTVVGDNYINTYRKYACLRPADMSERRFFLKYQNGGCCRMVMGIHKIGSAAKEVASYLQLPNWKEYTGHCLRRSGPSLLDDDGEADVTRYPRRTN